MFTGIIKEVGEVVKLQPEQNNVVVTIKAAIASELKVDQSVSHNGVCLTVVAINNDTYDVVAIKETLSKSNLSQVQAGDFINLERCLKIGDTLDGHFVQGHVDTTAKCDKIVDVGGSWLYSFSFPVKFNHLIVEKGSVCINGVSLTVVDPDDKSFCVAIIPYTYEHTNFKYLLVGDKVNVEFDILGKYITRHLMTSGSIGN